MVNYPELQENTELFREEYKAIINYFADDENPEGLTKAKAQVILGKQI